MGAVRLQKYIADCGIASRRKAEELIAEGKVRVNGDLVTTPGTKITPGVDKVRVGRKPALLPARGVFYLNKPRGVMSTLSDPGGRKTVAYFLTKKYKSYFPVGRLDYDSTGLLVMTNDGELAQRLAHPRYSMERAYQVRVGGHVSEKTLRRIQRGVRLEDGVVKADVKLMRQDEKSSWLDVRIHEGRNRVIRRLMDRLHHPVLKLHRVAHGPCKLSKLKSGQIRVLTQKEYETLRTKVFREPQARPEKREKSGSKSKSARQV